MLRALVLIAVIAGCGGDSPTGPEGGAPGSSRTNPAGVGQPVTVQVTGFISGDATLRLTFLRSVAGAAALDTLLAANQFNDHPPAGYEWVLGRFHVEVLALGNPAVAFEMWDGDWESFSSSGQLHPDAFFGSCCLAAPLEGEGFAGASWEGWVPLFAVLSDPAPVAVYQRGQVGEAWFTLRSALQ